MGFPGITIQPKEPYDRLPFSAMFLRVLSKIPQRITTSYSLGYDKPAVFRANRFSNFGFDHGVGHSLLVLCDAKAPHGKKWNDFKALENYLFIVSISLS